MTLARSECSEDKAKSVTAAKEPVKDKAMYSGNEAALVFFTKLRPFHNLVDVTSSIIFPNHKSPWTEQNDLRQKKQLETEENNHQTHQITVFAKKQTQKTNTTTWLTKHEKNPQTKRHPS